MNSDKINHLMMMKAKLLDLGQSIINEVNRIASIIDRDIAVEERKRLIGIDDKHMELQIHEGNKLRKLN